MTGSCLSIKIEIINDMKAPNIVEKSAKQVLAHIFVGDIPFILKGKLIHA